MTKEELKEKIGKETYERLIKGENNPLSIIADMVQFGKNLNDKKEEVIC